MRGWVSVPPGGSSANAARASNGEALGGDVATQLQALARRVRRLGLNGRFDPERAFIERDELAGELIRLSRRLERSAATLPAHPSPPATLPERTRRLEALLAGRRREIDRLRNLLAQAVRPSRRRRRAGPDAQLPLPLSEALDER